MTDAQQTAVQEILERYGQSTKPATREDIARLEGKIDLISQALLELGKGLIARGSL